MKRDNLDKGILNKINKFMTEKKINRYHHTINNLDILIKKPKEYKWKESNVKAMIFCVLTLCYLVCEPNLITILKSTLLTKGTLLILTFIFLYWFAKFIFEYHIRKDRNIYVTDIIKKQKDYSDSRFSNRI